MKVNIWQIILDHIDTLRNDVSKKISAVDIIIFFLLPVLVGVAAPYFYIEMSKEFYSISITFFGIFVALLLNFQVATFGIYNRKWNLSKDEKLSQMQKEELETRKLLLKQTNSNISYLILISSISILLFLFLFAAEKTGRTAAAISCIIYVHFILTLLMVVKRCHILFRKEYDEA